MQELKARSEIVEIQQCSTNISWVESDTPADQELARNVTLPELGFKSSKNLSLTAGIWNADQTKDESFTILQSVNEREYEAGNEQKSIESENSEKRNAGEGSQQTDPNYGQDRPLADASQGQWPQSRADGIQEGGSFQMTNGQLIEGSAGATGRNGVEQMREGTVETQQVSQLVDAQGAAGGVSRAAEDQQGIGQWTAGGTGVEGQAGAQGGEVGGGLEPGLVQRGAGVEGS